MSTSSLTLTVLCGCFFLNNRYNNKGPIYIFDHVSDLYPGATINAHLSTIKFDAQKCRRTLKFTTEEQKEIHPSLLFFIFIWRYDDTNKLKGIFFSFS